MSTFKTKLCDQCGHHSPQRSLACNHCKASFSKSRRRPQEKPAGSSKIIFEPGGQPTEADYFNAFALEIMAAGLPPPEIHQELIEGRGWECDLLWRSRRIIFELDGGVHTRGRHVRPLGFTGDLEKINAHLLLSWQVYRITPEHLRNGYAIHLLKLAFAKADGLEIKPGDLGQLHDRSAAGKLPRWARARKAI